MTSDERATGSPSPQAPRPKPSGGAREGAAPAGTSRPSGGSKLTVPGYEIRGEVGRGGMGIVYRARQTSIGREVAVKVLPAAAARDPAFVDKFLREAKAAARLNHENVVSAIDAGRSGDTVYFVMEFIDGETIRDRIDREGPLPLDLTLRVIRDTAKALVHARRHGLVHRDVKPDNIMVGSDGRALLCDLGLARMVDPSGGDKGKRTGTAEGTPYYIAPEQARGFADVDIRADIYALGATAYHMLAGEYPYDGADAREIMWKQVNKPFPDVTAKRDDLPASFIALLARTVEKDREKRMATPEEVVQALDAIMAETGTDSGEGNGAGAPPAAAAPPTSPKQIAVLAGGIALVLALTIGGGYAILGGGEKKPADAGSSGDGDELVPGTGASTGAGARDGPIAPPTGPTAAATPRKVPPPAPSDTAREAEAALKLAVLSESVRAESVSPAEAIRRLREVAANYAGTQAASKAEEEARALETRIQEALSRKLRDVDAIAADLAGRGEFLSAANAYAPLLEREKGGLGEQRVRDAVRRIEDASSAALTKLEKDLEGKVAEGKIDEAEKALAAFAARAAGPSAQRAVVAAADLKKAIASSAVAREADAAARGARDLVRKASYVEAKQAAADALQNPRFASVKASIEVAKRDADGAAAASAQLQYAFASRQGDDKVELPLLAGGTIAGKVMGYNVISATVIFLETFQREGTTKNETSTVDLRIADLDPAYLRKCALPSGKAEAHIGNGLVFLYRGALAAGVVELRAAERLGARLSSDVKAELEVAAKQADEAQAEATHRRGARLVGTGRPLAALKPLSRLLGKGDLASAGYARSFAKEIGELWKQGRAAELLEQPLQAFFAGKVEGKAKARSGSVRITYLFDDADEGKDWKPQVHEEAFKNSKVKVTGGVCEFTGRVCWRGGIKGDLAIEAAVTRGGTSILDNFIGVNANFMIYDRGRPWDGWLCGIGSRPSGMDRFNLSKNAQKNAGALYDFPSHVMARCKGSQSLTEFLFAARGPVPPATGGFRVAISARKRTITMLLMNKPLGTCPIPDADMQGGIAIQPHDDTLAIDQIQIAGEIDETWLQAEALARAEAELNGAASQK